MTNDILEQVAEDYFRSQGYFTQHNIKYRPEINKPRYRVHSDIDILAYHPKKNATDVSKVIVVNCKSWMGGFGVKDFLNALEKDPTKKKGGKDAWKHFRDLMDKEWADALQKKVQDLTGYSKFTHYTITTKYRGDKALWERSPMLRQNLTGCEVKLLSLQEMIGVLQEQITFTPAHSDLSRMLQLIKAGGGLVTYDNKARFDA